MKNKLFILFILLIVNGSLFAQNSLRLYIDNGIKKVEKAAFEDDDPAFKRVDIPDSLKKYSIVILVNKTAEYYDIKNKQNVVTTCTRNRVKILDKVGVTMFSEIYFRSGKKAYSGVRIIKSNGDTISADSRQMEDVTLDKGVIVPPFFQFAKKSNVIYKKFAVPGLEPGDIVDYYEQIDFVSLNPFDTYNREKDVFFQSEYPILFRIFDVGLSDDYSLSYISSNSNLRFVLFNPQYLKQPQGWDLYKVYRLTNDKNLLFNKEEYSNPYSFGNFIRYAIYGKNKKVQLLTYNPYSINDTIPSPILLKNKAYYYHARRNIGITGHSIISKKMLSEKDTAKYIEMAYCNVRNQLVLSFYYYLFRFRGTVPFNNFFKEKNFSSRDFSSAVYYFLKEKNIPAELVITTPNYYSGMKNLVSDNDILLGLYIPLHDTTGMYIFSYDYNTICGDIPWYLEGAEALRVKLLDKKPERLKPQNTVMIKLPRTSYQDNYLSDSTIVDLNFENGTLNGQSKIKITGLLKYDYTNLVGYNYYSIKEDSLFCDFKQKGVEGQNLIKKTIAQNKQKNEEQFRKEQFQLFQENLKSSITDAVLDSFHVINFGRFRDKPYYSYSLIYHVPNGIQKTGASYAVNIADIIGVDDFLNTKDTVRISDLYLRFAFMKEKQVELKIPRGYSVLNAKDLDIVVDNECCSFKASTVQNDNTFIIKIEKAFKHGMDPKDKWPLYMEMLDAAYAFSQKKIILKKQ